MAETAHIDHRELLLAAERLAGFGTWSMSLTTAEAGWSEGMYRLLGLEPGSVEPSAERLLQSVHRDDAERVRTALADAQADPGGPASRGIGMEYRVVWPDGSVRVIRGRGRAVREGDGWRWFGIEQDITDQRLTERELQAHYAVSQALREWESFEEGVIVLLRRMATALDFASAALWTWDERRELLACRAVYASPDLGASDWEATTRSLTFSPGDGLPGEVWETGGPISIPEVQSDPRFRRPEVASAVGIRSALLFPAIGPAGPIAVLAFYSYERREPGPRLLRTLSGIGSELGRFLQRRRAQLEPSPLSARELEVLGLAAEGLSGPQIAEQLVVSPSTVKTHFENIYEKLGIGDRAGAVAYALRIGLIS